MTATEVPVQCPETPLPPGVREVNLHGVGVLIGADRRQVQAARRQRWLRGAAVGRRIACVVTDGVREYNAVVAAPPLN